MERYDPERHLRVSDGGGKNLFGLKKSHWWQRWIVFPSTILFFATAGCLYFFPTQADQVQNWFTSQRTTQVASAKQTAMSVPSKPKKHHRIADPATPWKLPVLVASASAQTPFALHLDQPKALPMLTLPTPVAKAAPAPAKMAAPLAPAPVVPKLAPPPVVVPAKAVATPVAAKPVLKLESPKVVAKAPPPPAPAKVVSKPAPVAVAKAPPPAPVVAAASKPVAPKHVRAVVRVAKAPLPTALSPDCAIDPRTASEWKNFGGARFASSREEGMANRRRAIECLAKAEHLPEAAVAALMELTSHPGTRTTHANGTHLDATISKRPDGTIVVHLNSTIDFVNSPIRGMGYSANAEEWKITYEGRVITLTLFDICYNWTITSNEPVKSPEAVPQCVELSFNAYAHGHVRWGVGSKQGDSPLPASACNAQKQGDGEWTAWYGQCEACVPAIDYIRKILGPFAEVYHKYLYPVDKTRQTLRFSTAIWTRVTYVCLGDQDNIWTCGVYMRPQDWQGQYHVEISDSLWRRDDGNCPK